MFFNFLFVAAAIGSVSTTPTFVDPGTTVPLPVTTGPVPTTTTWVDPGTPYPIPTTSGGISPLYYQCGGLAWAGPVVCAAPYTCQYVNVYYSQCL